MDPRESVDGVREYRVVSELVSGWERDGCVEVTKGREGILMKGRVTKAGEASFLPSAAIPKSAMRHCN